MNKVSKWNITQAPLSSNRIDAVGPVLRGGVGLGFISYSAITTIVVFLAVLGPLLDWWKIVAIAVAFVVVVTLAEWATASFELWAAHWAIVLLLDAPFTTWQTHEWLWQITTAHYEAVSTEVRTSLWIASLVWGVVTAKIGEKLLIKMERD